MKKLLALFTLLFSLSLLGGNIQAQNRQTIDVGKIACGDSFTIYFNNGERHLGTSITLRFKGQNGNTATYCLREANVTPPGKKEPIGEVASSTTHYLIVGEVTRDGFCDCGN